MNFRLPRPPVAMGSCKVTAVVAGSRQPSRQVSWRSQSECANVKRADLRDASRSQSLCPHASCHRVGSGPIMAERIGSRLRRKCATPGTAMTHFLQLGPDGRPMGVWRVENDVATRIGVPDAKRGQRTYFEAAPGESVWDTIRRRAAFPTGSDPVGKTRSMRPRAPAGPVLSADGAADRPAPGRGARLEPGRAA
jgi:hypothetical protein